jgi:hypothetical protein
MPVKKQEKKLDIAKLQKMQEPITVLVYRVKQGNKIPVTLPAKDGGAPGTGWGRDDILQLQNWVQDNAGGGFYEATTTDANGGSMTWLFGWDPRVIPEKVPPASQANAAMPPHAPPPQPGQPVPMQMDPMMAAAALGGAGSGWLQTPQGFYPYAAGAQPQPQPTPMFGGAAAPWTNPMMWQQPPATRLGNGAPNTRERDLEAQLRQAQQAQQAAQYQQSIDRLQAQHNSELGKIRDELRRTAEKPSGESDEVKLLREQLAESKRDQQLLTMQQGFQSQIDKLAEIITKVAEGGNKGESDQIRELKEEQRRAEDRAARAEADRRHREEMAAIRNELAANKQDPMLEYMRESSRQQIEAQKDMARNQRETTQATTAMMVNPIQMMEMMNRQSGQSDAVTKQLIENFGAGFETYRMMMESLMQMQGGGQSPGMEMLSQGLQRAGEIANQYITAQRDKSVHDSRAKAQAAAAQAKTAEAYRAQAEAAQTRQPPSYDEQLRGPAEAVSEAPPTNGANGQTGAAQAADVISLDERRPPSEQEMFAEAYESVLHLREGVMNGSLPPPQAVSAILQGIAMCEQQQIIVPAFVLFAEGRFADLIDALLPEAEQAFRDECAQLFAQQFDDEPEEPAPSPPA